MAPTKRPPAVYWDACILLAFIKGEKRAADEMAGIDEVVSAIDVGEMALVTSVTSRAEIFVAELTPAQKERYHSLFLRGNCDEVPSTGPICDLVAEMRREAKKLGLSIKFQDWLHVATAIAQEVKEFHTFDGTGRADPKTKLIPLNGQPIVHGLKICTPRADQTVIPGTTSSSSGPGRPASR
jgi:predicted nucleic acid-binding protein